MHLTVDLTDIKHLLRRCLFQTVVFDLELSRRESLLPSLLSVVWHKFWRNADDHRLTLSLREINFSIETVIPGCSVREKEQK